MIDVKGSKSVTTVQAFTGAVESEIAGGLTRAALQEAAAKDSTKLAKWTQGYSLDTLQDHLGEKVIGFLQDDTACVFAMAWSKCAEIKQAAKASEGKKTLSSVALTDHEFSYGIEPDVDVLIDGILLGRFAFSIKMLCAVSALELSLKDGCVAAIAAGKVKGGTVIELAGQQIWKKEFAHADLPGTLTLKKPLKL